jgi:hypothetical protein
MRYEFDQKKAELITENIGGHNQIISWNDKQRQLTNDEEYLKITEKL